MILLDTDVIIDAAAHNHISGRAIDVRGTNGSLVAEQGAARRNTLLPA